MTIPVSTKKTRVTRQRSTPIGFKKIHMSLLAFTLTIVPTPISVNGVVNSTYCDLLSVIVTSPTTASYF